MDALLQLQQQSMSFVDFIYNMFNLYTTSRSFSQQYDTLKYGVCCVITLKLYSLNWLPGHYCIFATYFSLSAVLCNSERNKCFLSISDLLTNLSGLFKNCPLKSLHSCQVDTGSTFNKQIVMLFKPLMCIQNSIWPQAFPAKSETSLTSSFWSDRVLLMSSLRIQFPNQLCTCLAVTSPRPHFTHLCIWMLYEVPKRYQISICHIYHFSFFPRAGLTSWKIKLRCFNLICSQIRASWICFLHLPGFSELFSSIF